MAIVEQKLLSFYFLFYNKSSDSILNFPDLFSKFLKCSSYIWSEVVALDSRGGKENTNEDSGNN